jgi:hypothetical protein
MEAAAPALRAGSTTRIWQSPVWVAALVTALYIAVTAGILAHHPAQDFAFVGKTFVSRATTPAITGHAHPTSQGGYDGQFALFIALDPVHAPPAVDKPPYRYSHILYPALARALALGQDRWVPAALIALNLLSVFVATIALGLLLRRIGRSPAYALLFGLFAGTFVTFNRDLTDLLAYALVALALLALRWDSRRQIALAAAAFAGAALSRETTLIFPAVLAAVHVLRGAPPFRRRLVDATILAVVSAAPYLAWRAFVLHWLGSHGTVPALLAPYPFAGLVPHGEWDATLLINLSTIVVPSLLVLLVVARNESWRRPSPFAAIVAVQVVVLMSLLPRPAYADYYASGRIQMGTVVAALCWVPALGPLSLRYRRVLGVAAVLAMAPSLAFALIALSGTPV